MTLPLYKISLQQPESREPEGHAGLWFDKFCNTWKSHGSTWEITGKEKLPWIRTLVDHPTGTQSQIEEYALRLIQLVEKHGGKWGVFKAESRFVTGLGRSHPVENGFAWHPTLGTPFLPGPSVKGLVRAWARTTDEPHLDSKTENDLLGDNSHAGCVSFLDSVPVSCVSLEADVMTPHYADWDVDNPPGDWCSPTPIPFLTAAANTTLFLFSFIPCRPVSDKDMNTLWNWLCSATELNGVGAKTAIGYGRFTYDDKQTLNYARLQKNRYLQHHEELLKQEAMRSPEGRWRLKIDGKSELDVLEMVRIYLEKEPLEDSFERKAFSQAVVSIYPEWVRLWKRGEKGESKTNVGEKKLKERANVIYRVLSKVDKPL